MTTGEVLLHTDGLFGDRSHPDHRGKVRDTYIINGVGRLIVTTDRISAFDVVMPQGIPGKGRVLNQMTIMWLKRLEAAKPHHLLTARPNSYPEPFCRHADILDRRSMLVTEHQVLPVEAVVRGYLAGSGWKEYQASGTVCNIPLPIGLKESDRLPEPILTPATKAEEGHDINISHNEAVELLRTKLGLSLWEARQMFARLKSRSLEIYTEGAEFALARGIIVADTKFEWGRQGIKWEHGDIVSSNKLILIDEVLTPDSSRFWPLDDYEPGRPQKSLDKQPLRDRLDSIGWNHQPPAPDLPAELVSQTSQRYQEIQHRLAG